MNATKYGKLFDTLRNDILSGKYPLNAPLPSVRALISRFGLSDRTVRHALDELSSQGLISRKQGRGTFVSVAGASRKIGLIMPDYEQSEYFMRIFRELMRESEHRQYMLLFGGIRGLSASERAVCAERLINDFIRQRVSGVIFQPIEYFDGSADFNNRMLSLLDQALIPVVLCDNGVDAATRRHDVVGVNNLSVIAPLYRHLVEEGAKRICFFMRPYSPLSHLERAQGFALARLSGLSGSLGKESVLVAEPDEETVIRRKIKVDRVDAFMCGDDETAAKLMQTLHRLGYSVPGDVMVTGFNDLSMARLLSPSLTTVRTNCEAIARTALDRLVARIGNPDLPPTEIFLPVEPVIRESSHSARLTRAGRKAFNKRNKH